MIISNYEKDKLINARTGLLKGLQQGLNYDLPIPMYISRAYGNPLVNKVGLNITEEISDGYGTSFHSYEESDTGAIGEAVERYAANIIKGHNIIKSTYLNLKNMAQAIDPTTITRPSKEQYYHRIGKRWSITGNDELYWVKGHNLLSGNEAWIPADTVFLGENEKIFKHTIRDVVSTGLAAGPSYEFAVEKGLLECIERDAIVIMWLNKISPARIEPDSIGGKVQEIYNNCLEKGLSLTILDITTNIKVPTIFAIVTNKYDQIPYVQIGAKSDYSLYSAIKGAVEEAVFGFNLFAKKKVLKSKDISNPKNINDILDHIVYYASGHGLTNLNFLYNGEKVNYGDLNYEVKNISVLLNTLKRLKIEPFHYNLTTIDIEEVNIFVSRVVVPKLAFLEVQEPLLECKRIYEVPKLLGFRNIKELNTNPHPFP